MPSRLSASSGPTVHSIAKACGVSPTTVSLAMHDDPRLRPETRQKIQQYAAEVGYRPHRTAQDLKRGSTGIIGLILPNPTYWVETLMIDALYRHVHAQGLDIQLHLTHDDVQQEARSINRCLDQRVDGLILIASFERLKELPSDYPIREISDGRLPCVIFGSSPNGTVRVQRDRGQAAYLGARHLIEQGYDCIKLLVVSRSTELFMHRTRVSGMAQAAREMGVRFEEDDHVHYRLAQFNQIAGSDPNSKGLFHDYQDHFRLGYELAKDAIDSAKSGARVGLVCANDLLASGALLYCRHHDLKVPQKIGVTGCDNTFAPGLDLTSFKWDHDQMGRFILDSLKSQKAGPVDGHVKKFEPELLIRGSTSDASSPGFNPIKPQPVCVD